MTFSRKYSIEFKNIQNPRLSSGLKNLITSRAGGWVVLLGNQ